jgi:hypothetical protein
VQQYKKDNEKQYMANPTHGLENTMLPGGIEAMTSRPQLRYGRDAYIAPGRYVAHARHARYGVPYAP